MCLQSTSWVNRTGLPGARLRDEHRYSSVVGLQDRAPAGHRSPQALQWSWCSRGWGETPAFKEENRKIHPGSCRWAAEPRNLRLLKTHFPQKGLRKASSMAQVPTWGQVPLIISLCGWAAQPQALKQPFLFLCLPPPADPDTGRAKWESRREQGSPEFNTQTERLRFSSAQLLWEGLCSSGICPCQLEPLPRCLEDTNQFLIHFLL